VSESPLSRETIIAEAIELLNENGLDGVTLRKLATRLGIKAPSLYWHFRDKGALLSAVMETVFQRGLDAVPAHRDWRKWMRAFGLAMWRTQQVTRDFSRLVTTTDMDDAQLARTRALLRRALQRLDLPVAEAMRLQSSVQALVLGWSAFAHAPYADKLASAMDFTRMLRRDLTLLLAGEATRRTRTRRAGK
jgi:TetR/AcrR family transcriptional regulator, tetracycline repressor protein